MLRRLLPRRGFSTSTSTSLHTRTTALFEKIMDAEWVNTDQNIDPMLEDASALVDEYRPLYTPGQPEDALYKDMANLYVAKESASMVQAYGEYSERFIRSAEHSNGIFGGNTEVKEGDTEEPLQMIREYVKFVNLVEDKRIREKVEDELSVKIIHLKMIFSIENFSVEVAPIIASNVLTTPRPRAPLPPTSPGK